MNTETNNDRSSGSLDRLVRQRDLTYEEFLALGPDGAAECVANKLGLDAERKRKLAILLRNEWEAKPNVQGSATDGDSRGSCVSS